MVIAAESRAMKLALSAFVATTVHEPARRAVSVVPEIEQMPPGLVTAYVTAPLPEPPVVDSATVGSPGDGA